jgi:RNA polymerase sigma-70 factor (ECF subfamily)
MEFELFATFVSLPIVSEPHREPLWVLRAQSGDREALELLLRSVQPSLLRFSRALVGLSSADDVVQETLILVYRKLGQLTSPQLFRPWLFRIAKRAGLRHLKSARRWLDEFEDATYLSDLPAQDSRPTHESVEDLVRMSDVSPASRVVLLLHFQEGLSLPEIAAALELPLGTVKSRLGYGLSLLRKRLGEKARKGARDE